MSFSKTPCIFDHGFQIVCFSCRNALMRIVSQIYLAPFFYFFLPDLNKWEVSNPFTKHPNFRPTNSEVLCGLASRNIVLECLGVWYFDVLAWCWAVLCWLSLDWLLWVSPVHLSFWTPTSHLGNACGFLYFRRFKQWNMCFFCLFLHFMHHHFNILMILLMFFFLLISRNLSFDLNYCLFWTYLQFPYLSNHSIRASFFRQKSAAFLVPSTLRTPLWTRIVLHPWISIPSYKPSTMPAPPAPGGACRTPEVVVVYMPLCFFDKPLESWTLMKCPWFSAGGEMHRVEDLGLVLEVPRVDFRNYVMASCQKLWFWSCQLKVWV